jgi:hypothetical protein
MPPGPAGAEREGVASLPPPPRPWQARSGRLGGSYLVVAALVLVAASAARVPAGPVLVMAVLMAANAVVLAAARRPSLSGRPPSRCP